MNNNNIMEYKHNILLKRSKSYRGKANVRSESGRTAGRPCGEQENLGMKSVAPCCCSVVPLRGVPSRHGVANDFF